MKLLMLTLLISWVLMVTRSWQPSPGVHHSDHTSAVARHNTPAPWLAVCMSLVDQRIFVTFIVVLITIMWNLCVCHRFITEASLKHCIIETKVSVSVPMWDFLKRLHSKSISGRFCERMMLPIADQSADIPMKINKNWHCWKWTIFDVQFSYPVSNTVKLINKYGADQTKHKKYRLEWLLKSVIPVEEPNSTDTDHW